jgi:Nif-specific regulatory protein
MTISLVQINGTAPGASVTLDPNAPPVTIGRDPAREVPIDDHQASRLHCRVWFDGAAWRVEDCNSRNGTFVNSRRIDTATLRPGDAIRVGERLLVFIQQGEQTDGAGWQPALLESTTFVARVPSAEQKDAVVGQLKGKSNPDSVRNAAILCRLAGELHEQDSIESLLSIVCQALESGTHANAIVIWLTGSDGRLRRYGADSDGRPQAPSPLAALVIHQQEALLVEQTAPSSGRGGANESTFVGEQPTSAICVPIPHRSGCRGAIECLKNSPAEPLTPSNLELCIAVARQAGLALENLEYRERLERANVQLRTELAGRHRLVGESEPIRRLLEMVARVSATESTVLLSGESGTGKELVARMIHDSSPRASGPYVAVNCAAFHEALLESELFGHEKGAFTGATRQHLGQFERAHRGTIFLDEIGELSVNCQAKLLRILEGHPFERVGGSDRIEVDVRIVAATHRHLPDLIRDGRFREDVYFRLRVIELSIPPLRDRGDDVFLLANHFLDHYRQKLGTGPLRLSRAASETLRSHTWPGNIRELKNAIERAIVLGTRDEIQPDDLGLREHPAPSGSQPKIEPAASPPPAKLLEAELRHIQTVLQQTGGNKTEACRLLGIGRGTLYKKIKEIEDRFGA